jgi:pentatricopeptide repeat protein
MPIGNALSWMPGLVKCRQGQMALDFYQQLQQEGVEPTTVTFVGVLSACASISPWWRRACYQMDLNFCIRWHLSRRKTMLGECSKECPVWCGCMECNNFGLCETWVRAEDLGISLLNATGKGICKMCHLDSTLNACARLSALDEVRRILKQIVQSGMHLGCLYW